MMPVTLQLQPQRVVFWGRMKRQIVTKHKSRICIRYCLFSIRRTLLIITAENILNFETFVKTNWTFSHVI